MVTELITPGELFFADGATERSLNHVLDGLELAPALSCIHHHLYLQETSCNLKQMLKNIIIEIFFVISKIILLRLFFSTVLHEIEENKKRFTFAIDR